MVLLKIALVGVAIAVIMGMAREQHWFQRAGFVGVCAATTAPYGEEESTWYACKQGLLNGFPNLEADSCSRDRMVAHQEIWRCTVPITSVPGM